MNKKFLLILCFIFLSALIYAENQQTLTFAQAAELAVKSSLDLKHARQSNLLSEGAWSWGVRAYFPQFNISVSENDRLQKIGADSFMKNYSLGLDQMIWDGGRISMSRKLERMELNLISSKLDRMSNEIAESAIAAYRNILLYRTILQIKKETLIVLEEHLKILNEEVQLGLALPVDLSSANINLSDTKIDIFYLLLDLAEMEKQFTELLGLEVMPVLTEKVDPNRSSLLPAASAASALAKEQNPDLIEAGHSIIKRQMELKYISRSWIPSLRISSNFVLTGQRYPLTRYNWSVGLSLDFSNPWFNNRFGFQAGWEPPYDRTAMLQNNLSPLPDPASSFGKKHATLTLALEQEKYRAIYEQIGRIAANAVEKCSLAEQRRLLALESAILGSERSQIEEIRLDLGLITRLKLMETIIEQTQREINLIEAATSLLEAERELERFLDLQPGELSKFAQTFASVRGNQ